MQQIAANPPVYVELNDPNLSLDNDNMEIDQPTNPLNNRVSQTAPNKRLQTLILFIWQDSYLCLSEPFVPLFIKGETSAVEDKEVEENAALEAKPYVFWNNGQGICRLVALSQLKTAFTSCRPQRIHAIQVKEPLFDEMFQEIFGAQTTDPKEPKYCVVGGLDSNSKGSNFLQWRIKEAFYQLNPEVRQADQARQAQRAAQQAAQQG
jgi:hypothetical protein